jgi:hypothetical protein
MTIKRILDWHLLLQRVFLRLLLNPVSVVALIIQKLGTPTRSRSGFVVTFATKDLCFDASFPSKSWKQIIRHMITFYTRHATTCSFSVVAWFSHVCSIASSDWNENIMRGGVRGVQGGVHLTGRLMCSRGRV